MTLEEAIKRLGKIKAGKEYVFLPLSQDALSEGIEALKRCRHNYLNPQRADFRRLPGETEE